MRRIDVHKLLRNANDDLFQLSINFILSTFSHTSKSSSSGEGLKPARANSISARQILRHVPFY